MSEFDLILTLLGGMVLLLGVASRPLSASPLPPTLVALGVGILIGPHGLGLLDLGTLGDEALIRERLARLTLAVGLVGVALRVPRAYPRRHLRDLSLLVGAGMLMMWGISAGLALLFLDFPLWLAVLVGAIVTATDPIAAGPIVTGTVAEQNVPARVRHAISFESGANDGLSFLFVYLAFLLLTRAPGEALSHWLVHTLLWDVGVATVMGVVLGFAAARLLRVADRADSMADEWRLVYTVALGLFAVGAGRLAGSDEVLVVFAAAAVFVQAVPRDDREEEDSGQEAVNRFFAIPIFTVLGLTIPWEGWRALGWAGVGLAAAVLLLRRIPVLLVLRPLLGTLRTVPEALFVGWFGPVAVAAIYYASIMEHRLADPRVWHAVSMVVVASVVAHGVTGAPFTRWLGRTAGPPDDEAEDGEAGQAERPLPHPG